ECADETCLEKIPLTTQQFLAIESDRNRFIVLRGHELPDVEDVVAVRDGFLIVSMRGAAAVFIDEHSYAATVARSAGWRCPVRLWRPHRRLDDPDALAAEDLVEGARCICCRDRGSGSARRSR